ncbi:hypothetical protein B0T17DRAFT_240310 [Bombardia bombarda]|uniref:C2H2-type domain-containing protein n=1 Tax=Bombardia bombarda TaxID=252184 RepID=A0AA40CB47_9PEZI|nr:hypothetical protein B0T17DRAFT_240310 [Bombardia bombarda]
MAHSDDASEEEERVATISETTRQVRQRFSELIVHIKTADKPPLASTLVADAFERFALWAGNLGALRRPTSRLSLDYRLSEAPDLREYICEELQDMLEAIQDVTDITQGIRPNRDMTSSSDFGSEFDLEPSETAPQTESQNEPNARDRPSDEAHSILEVIKACITSLFRVGMLVRKAAPRDRFKRALRASNLIFPASFDIEHVKHKYPKVGDGSLAVRLGSAIAKRRQFIKYCRDHKSRLAADETDDDDDDRDGGATARLSSKATTFEPRSNFMMTLRTNTFAEEALESEDVHTRSTSTSASGNSTPGALKLPRLADLTPDSTPFECPICFMFQSFKLETQWRIHAYRDLKAYVCTLGGEACDSELFGDRNSWFDHELIHHRAHYKCSLCNKGPFASSDLRAHILESHGKFSNEQLLMLQDGGRKPIAGFSVQDCPFCDDWTGGRTRSGKNAHNENVRVSTSLFKRHVASHQEQLAIFALPRTTEDEGSSRSSLAGSLSDGILVSDDLPLVDDMPTPTSDDIPASDADGDETRISNVPALFAHDIKTQDSNIPARSGSGRSITDIGALPPIPTFSRKETGIVPRIATFDNQDTEASYYGVEPATNASSSQSQPRPENVRLYAARFSPSQLSEHLTNPYTLFEPLHNQYMPQPRAAATTPISHPSPPAADATLEELLEYFGRPLEPGFELSEEFRPPVRPAPQGVGELKSSTSQQQDNSTIHRSRNEREDEPDDSTSPEFRKGMLSKAFRMVNQSVQLGASQDLDSAIKAYSDASDLVRRALQITPASKDREDLSDTLMKYTNRIAGLRRRQESSGNTKRLPHNPKEGVGFQPKITETVDSDVPSECDHSDWDSDADSSSKPAVQKNPDSTSTASGPSRLPDLSDRDLTNEELMEVMRSQFRGK